MAYNMYGQPSWGSQMMNQNPYYQQPQQSYGMPVAQNTLVPQRPVFVDGEMAARVFQMPENWPMGIPLYLWDMSGDCFYMKMIGQNGMPMPMRTFDFKEREPAPSGYLSGSTGPDMSQFITKTDFDQKFNELKQMMRSNQNANNNQQQNRGAD